MRAERVPAATEATVVTLKRTSGHRKKADAAYRRMSIKNASPQGSGLRLLHAINRAMAENGHTVDEVAEMLGVSPVYLRAIGNGARSFAKVDRSILKNAAAYLGIPVAQAYLMSDAMDATDFFYQSSVENELHLAYNSMTTHPMWAGYAPTPEQWDIMDTPTKMFVCMLYESVTSQRFLTPLSVEVPLVD